MIATDLPTLEELAEGKGEDEYGRMIAQAYNVLGHLAARHSDVVAFLNNFTVGGSSPRVSRDPHDHPSGGGPCMWCALSPEMMTSLEANLIELMMLPNRVDRETVFKSKRGALSRAKVSSPSEEVLARALGPYWFDVLALPLELVHASPYERSVLLQEMTGEKLTSANEQAGPRHAMVWVAESTLRSMAWRRGGLPLTGTVPRHRVLQLASALWERSKGSLAGTGRIDQTVRIQRPVRPRPDVVARPALRAV